MRAFCLFVIVLSIAFQAKASQPDTTFRAGYFIVDSISLEGNKVTKPKIMLRELTFKVGDTIQVSGLSKHLERSKYNLTNTLLFNFVEVDTSVAGEKLNIHIKVVERWYIFPIPFVQIAERNFNAWWANKDFSRLDYGMYILKNNFRGRKETITALIRLGFNEQYRLTYEIPYINKKQTLGLSFSSGYSQHHEIYYLSDENRQLFYKDNDKRSTLEFDVYANVHYRQGYYFNHLLGAGYRYAWAQDTVIKLNPNYFEPNEEETRFLELNYFFQYDYRDSKIYPLKGHYVEFLATKYGLGILKKEKTDVWGFELRGQKFFQLGKRWYLQGDLKGKLSAGGRQPYYVQRGLGYFLDFIRGYEAYVIDGQHYGLFKSNLKFAIIPTKVLTLKFIKQGRFNPIPYALYTNLYYDGGYVIDDQFQKGNPLSNSYQHGFGLGVDFVTYYDRVLRVEYSVNKLGESGFFVHFTSSL